MNEDQIRKIVQEMIDAQQIKDQYNVAKTPYHTHNGLDSPKLNASTVGVGAAGSDTQVQFNNNGTLGASSRLSFLNASAELIVGDGSIGGTVAGGDADSGSGNPGSSITLQGGRGDGTGIGGAVNLQGGLPGLSGGDGGDVVIQSGLGALVGKGGDVDIQAQVGGDTSGDGGAVNITSGSAQGANSVGGNINATAGDGFGSGSGGEVEITSGVSAGSGPGGEIRITAGTSGNLGGHRGPPVIIDAGGSDSGVASGDVYLNQKNAPYDRTLGGGNVYLPYCAGVPTGVPQTSIGALIYDSTNNKIYIYNGAWRSVAVT